MKRCVLTIHFFCVTSRFVACLCFLKIRLFSVYFLCQIALFFPDLKVISLLHSPSRYSVLSWQEQSSKCSWTSNTASPRSLLWPTSSAYYNLHKPQYVNMIHGCFLSTLQFLKYSYVALLQLVSSEQSWVAMNSLFISSSRSRHCDLFYCHYCFPQNVSMI